MTDPSLTQLLEEGLQQGVYTAAAALVGLRGSRGGRPPWAGFLGTRRLRQ